jgi:hypothetical protein
MAGLAQGLCMLRAAHLRRSAGGLTTSRLAHRSKLTAQLRTKILAAGTLACFAATAQEDFDRTVLPIQLPKPPTYTELDARNVEAPPRVFAQSVE